VLVSVFVSWNLYTEPGGTTMRRCPAEDYADRCKVIELEQDMLTTAP
jgi:hypothetical protein